MTRARDLGDFIADGAAAELVVDTTTLVVDSTNNRVGIGTASPSQALDVSGTGNFTAVTAGTITIDDITINGSTISDGGDLTIDVAGDIILDSDAANWRFKDAGTSILEIGADSQNPVIYSAVADKDIQFKGNDGGSTVTALTLDMSNAGNAIFGNDAVLAATKRLYFDETGNTSINEVSGTDLAFYTGSSERMRINSSGNVIIGETSPINGGNLNVATSAADATISALCRSTTDSHGVTLVFQKSSTNSGNFAATADGENLGKILFRGVNTSTVSKVGAQISVVQNGTDSSTVPADMVFTTKEAERFRMGSLGQLGIGGATYGTSGQVLTSGGASAAPTWGDVGGGGKVLQVVKGSYTGYTTISSNSFTNISLSVNITLTSSSNRVMVWAMGGTLEAGGASTGGMYARLIRKIGSGSDTTLSEGNAQQTANKSSISQGTVLALGGGDAPATSSAVTYKVQVKSDNGNAIYVNYYGGGDMTIIAMEIAV